MDKAPPDGYAIQHMRYDDSVYFGPFATFEELHKWLEDHCDVHGVIIPLYKTVNWAR